MGRTPKYSVDEILDAAGRLLAEDGPAALTITRVAASLGAPSGSIYHRFRSRDVLVATLWMRTVEEFQRAVGPALTEPDPHDAARTAARRILGWARTHPDGARVLLLYRSRDLLDGEWPTDLVDRNLEQRARIETMLGDLCVRLGATRVAQKQRVAFAVIEIPSAAARSTISRGQVPSRALDAIVDDAVTAVLLPLATDRGPT